MCCVGKSPVAPRLCYQYAFNEGVVTSKWKPKKPPNVCKLAIISSLLLLLHVVCQGAEAKVPVNVLSLMFSSNFPDGVVNALNAGFAASMAAREKELRDVADISLIYPSSKNDPISEVFEQALEESKDQLLVVFGPLGNDNVLWSNEPLNKSGVVAIGPLSYSDEVRGWKPNLYFTTAEPGAELLALVRYSVAFLRVARIGIMYLKNTFYGDRSYEVAQSGLTEMGYELYGTFALDGNSSEAASVEAFETEWAQFVEGRPLAVLLFGSPHAITGQFITRVAVDERTSEAYILAPSNTQTFLIKTWKEALSESGAELIPGQLIISGTNPLANETRYEVIRRFQREMNAYLDSTDERRGFDKPPHFLEDDTNGELMVAGWIAGEVIAKALQNAASLGNRDAFMHSLYDQRRYLIDDLVLGDYGGPCVNLAAWQGATCKCNQGGSVVYMKEVVDGYRLRSIRQGFLTWGTDQCSSDGVVLQAPLNGLTVLMTDNEVAYRASSRYASGASAFLGNGRAGERDRLFLQPLEATGAEAPDKLEEMRDIKVVSAIFAAVNKGIMGIEDIMFIDPITLTPRLNRFKRHLIYLSPTLAQEFYVLAQYISETASGSTNIIIRTHDAEEILKTLTATLVTFGVPIGAKVQVEEDGWMMDHLPTSGNVFLIGLKLEEIEPMATHLNNYRGVRVFVIYPDLTLMYEEFKDAFINSPQSSKDRLVFATNQLHWADVNSTSATIKAYHAVITDETMRTPMTLRGFTTARLMQTVLTQMRVVSAELLSSYFFDASTITIDDMRYGPYSDVDCIVNGVALATNCLANYGATNIAVWSMSRIFDPQVSELQSGMTPSLVYIDRSGLTLSQIIGITVGSLIAVLLFAVLGVTLFITLRNARDNDRAPTEPLDPVTVIFTDIESSTAQWAAFPEFMPDAVATHHSVVRSLIAQHNCYEVKTIGDSFMIACRSPLAAVDLCCEMQRHFLHHDWRTELFDEFYRNFEGQRAQEDKEYAPPSANLDPEVYREMWNGLRVRIGIHTGLCDIRYDQVTKGYDYYGQTTNMAARTESVANGGQVLLTGATYYSLSAAERDKFDVTPLGPVPLRGVSEVVDMFQVNAVPCRKFAALRLDREYYFEDGADGTTATTSDNSSTPAELSESAQMLACSLQALLSTFKPPQREKLLLPYCERWRVPLPKPRKPIWDDEYCQEVVRCLAMKVGRVVDHSAGGTTEVTSSTRSTSIIILSNRFISFDDNYSAE